MTPVGATGIVGGFVPVDVMYPDPRSLHGMQIRLGVRRFAAFVAATGVEWAIARAVRDRPPWPARDVTPAPRVRRRRRGRGR